MAVTIDMFRFIVKFNLYSGECEYLITFNNKTIISVNGPYSYFGSIPTGKNFKDLDSDMTIASYAIYSNQSKTSNQAKIYRMANMLAQSLRGVPSDQAAIAKTQFLSLIEEKKLDEARHFVEDVILNDGKTANEPLR